MNVTDLETGIALNDAISRKTARLSGIDDFLQWLIDTPDSADLSVRLVREGPDGPEEFIFDASEYPVSDYAAAIKTALQADVATDQAAFAAL